MNFLRAARFPTPSNFEVVSQPLIARITGMTLHVSCPRTQVVLPMSQNFDLGDFQKNEDFSFSENNLNIK